MTEIVIIDAVRSPIGKRNGGLSTLHPGAMTRATAEIANFRPSSAFRRVSAAPTSRWSMVASRCFPSHLNPLR